jgi:hypothetical protein
VEKTRGFLPAWRQKRALPRRRSASPAILKSISSAPACLPLRAQSSTRYRIGKQAIHRLCANGARYWIDGDPAGVGLIGPKRQRHFGEHDIGVPAAGSGRTSIALQLGIKRGGPRIGNVSNIRQVRHMPLKALSSISIYCQNK